MKDNTKRSRRLQRLDRAKEIARELKASLTHLELQVQNRMTALRAGICTPEELIKYAYEAHHNRRVANGELGFDSNDNDF